MRIECNPVIPKPVNPYNAAAEKAVSARRSFQVRKKIAKRSTGPQGWAGLDKAAMLGQWMSADREQTLTNDRRNPL